MDMRSFENLETGAFKAFWLASETLSFTDAARRGAMTQSGVSQHISKLEKQLGVPLFLRVNKKVVLTDAGKKLRGYVDAYLDELEWFREDILDAHHSLKGKVSYSMPESCLMSPHFGILLKERAKFFPALELKVGICPSDEVVELLVRAEIDFGFVTQRSNARGVSYTPFCFEEYVLVGKHKKLFQEVSTLANLPFLWHPGVDVLFDHWHRFHFPSTKRVPWSDLNVVGEMGSIKGVIEMLNHSVGVTVLPRHCVDEQLRSKTLVEYIDPSKGRSKNQIYIVTLDRERIPKRVETVIQTFMKMAH